MKKDMTLLIFSCDKFSDLWYGHVKMLEQNWGDRNIQTYIVTDTNLHKYKFDTVDVMAVGKDLEWTERLKYALNHVNTKYVFFTLDDYFLIKKVDDLKINRLLEISDKDDIDYIRLFHRPWCFTPYKKYKSIYKINLEKDQYSVNLYSGIWNVEFFKKMIVKPLNVWNFEVSLTSQAIKNNGNCLMSKGKEFCIMDVIRKGKILRNANRFFLKHPDLYKGNREIMKFKDELFIEVRTISKKLMPNFIVKKLKAYGRKKGMKFYSE